MDGHVRGFIRWKKATGKHHMYCSIRKKRVILGKGRPDGDIAYFPPHHVPTHSSWERLDQVDVAAELAEKVGDAEGTLEVVERSPGWYDVVNTATKKPINTSGLRKAAAEELAAGSPPPSTTEESPECPQGFKFGEDNEKEEVCDDCDLYTECAEKKATDEEGAKE